jgi:hypothetical protein
MAGKQMIVEYARDMRSTRLIRSAFVLGFVLAAGACASKTNSADSTLASTPPASAVETTIPASSDATSTSATTTVATPSSTIPIATVPEPTTTAIPTTVALGPLAFSEPRALGPGYVNSFSPDGLAVIVAVEDADRSKTGCEGVLEPVLLAAPVAGDSGAQRRSILPNDALRNGEILHRGNTTVMIDGCEGFVSEIAVVQQADDGTVGETRIVEPVQTDVYVTESASAFTLTLDGTALLSTYTEEGSNTIARLDLATGVVTRILPEIDGGRQVEEATDGRIVVSTGKKVSVVGPDGTVQRTYDASEFDVSDDGTRIALTKKNKLWVTDVGADLGEPTVLPHTESGDVRLSPDNQTALVSTYQEPGWIAVVRNGEVADAVSSANVFRVTWNRAGSAFAYSGTSAANSANVQAFVIDVG